MMYENDDMTYEEMRELLPLRAIGVSNYAFPKFWYGMYQLQFYDIDRKPDAFDLDFILDIFPNDCITFKTEKGFHFVSFEITVRDCFMLSRETSYALDEHYGCRNSLVLRVSPKFNRERREVGPRPKFNAMIKAPKKNTIISMRHLHLYERIVGLPREISQIYRDNCKMADFGITYHYYHTKARESDKKDVLNTNDIARWFFPE